MEEKVISGKVPKNMIKIFGHAMERKSKDIQGHFFENMRFSRNFQDFQGYFKNSRKFKEVQGSGHHVLEKLFKKMCFKKCRFCPI